MAHIIVYSQLKILAPTLVKLGGGGGGGGGGDKAPH